MDAKTARKNMLDWAEGGLSHHNMILGVVPFEHHGTALTLVPMADAAETTKWAAVYMALMQEERDAKNKTE